MHQMLALAALFVATSAHAAPWTIDATNSTLSFTGKQASEEFTGQFSQFTPVVELDPAAPEKGSIKVTVDMNSATIADKDKNDSLPTTDWFDSVKFPLASFESSAISKTGDHQFAAAGILTIKGIHQPLTLTFTLSEANGITRADGSVQLERQKFNIGLGQWKDDQWIAYPVTVTFHLQATQ